MKLLILILVLASCQQKMSGEKVASGAFSLRICIGCSGNIGPIEEVSLVTIATSTGAWLDTMRLTRDSVRVKLLVINSCSSIKQEWINAIKISVREVPITYYTVGGKLKPNCLKVLRELTIF